MQNVSQQLVDALKRKEGIELRTIIQRAPWKGIGLTTTLFLFKLLVLIPRMVREFKPDVILFSSMVTAAVSPFLGKKTKVPMVTINHGQDVTLPMWIYQKYLPVVFRRMNGVISVSQATRTACINRGMAPEIGITLPNGLDNRNRESVGKNEARKRLSRLFGVDPRERSYLLLTVGRQVKRKGHVWFIREVLPKLQQKVNYLIIGEGPENENIRRAADESAYRDSIFLAGRQPDELLKLAYTGSDLFVMPNIPVEGDMEGFGIVLLEANQVGLPAIASDLEGIQDVIVQGINGYRVSHTDPGKFAKKMDKVLGKELERLSATSKKYVLENFSWDTVVKEYVNFLEKVRYGRE
ncbi:MAG: glycosyltransferase family 4 protein [Balneolaceae bacterium]